MMMTKSSTEILPSLLLKTSTTKYHYFPIPNRKKGRVKRRTANTLKKGFFEQLTKKIN